MQRTVLSLMAAAVLSAPAVGFAAEPSVIKLEDAAREFRIRVYAEYRRSRSDYDQWREAGDLLLGAARRNEASTDRKEAALAWFQGATEAVGEGQTPDLPEFVFAAKTIKRPRRRSLQLNSDSDRVRVIETTNEPVLQLDSENPFSATELETPLLERRPIDSTEYDIEFDFAPNDSRSDEQNVEFDENPFPPQFDPAQPQDRDSAAVQGGTVQGGTVQGGTVQGGTVQGGTVQGGTLQGGTLQGGTVLGSLRKAVFGGERTQKRTPAPATPFSSGNGR